MPGQPARAAGLLDWLAHEICTQPRSRWEDAMWLCRVHAWDFAAGWDGPSQAALSRATAGYCQDQLHGLVEELAQEPSANLMVRLAGSRGAGRQIWAALASAFEPPSSRLAGLRQRYLRRRECPACRARNSARQRLAELIALAMSDPATRDAYEHSAGLCYRHLPLACGAARDQEQLRALSSTARSRLEILQWELDEVLRKESWSVRYEPRRGEVSAWRRTAAQVSGLLGREHAAWAMTGAFSPTCLAEIAI
ncbi:MAG TPA: hypothetical protein VK457_05370 [Chloroflexota bacterium]|nr:hypothetical protein [Chloroflexota bacterium]